MFTTSSQVMPMLLVREQQGLQGFEPESYRMPEVVKGQLRQDAPGLNPISGFIQQELVRELLIYRTCFLDPGRKCMCRFLKIPHERVHGGD